MIGNNVDLSSVRCSDIHLKAILQVLPEPSIIDISLKITYLKFLSNLPGKDEPRSHYTNTSSVKYEAELW